jgi:hypothetical protein
MGPERRPIQELLMVAIDFSNIADSPEVVFEASVMTRRVKGRKRTAPMLGASSRLYEALVARSSG